MSAQRTQKEEERRVRMLEGGLWPVLTSVALPLVIYNSVSQVFGFFDTLVASGLGANIVSIVSFNSQINSMFAALASGLAIGGGVIVARFFGAGDTESVGRNINTLFFFSLGLALLVILVALPLAPRILRLLSMPEDLVAAGTAPFMIDTLLLAPLFINTIWYAVEKSMGNTKVILWCNLLLLVLKLALTILLVFVLHGGVIALSLATLGANAAISAIALCDLGAKDNRFRLSLRKADFSSRTLGRILSLSLPVFLEKFAFSFGKVWVNSMSASWGSTVIGALGVSNRIGGLATNPPNGVEEASASLISQNLGNRNTKRALGIFWRALAINLGLGVFFFALMSLCMDPVIALFAKGDPRFAVEIRKIYNYERDGTIPVAAASAAMGLLYGFGYTKTAMVLDMLRLFAFRIPPLWIIRTYTNMGSEGVGLAMFISNAAYGLVATACAIVIATRMGKKQQT